MKTDATAEDTASANRIKVLVIDDHPSVRLALEARIRGKLDMEWCGEAGSAREAVPLLEATTPHAAIVDISLEDVHGLDLVAYIHSHYPAVRVVVYSMFDEDAYGEQALKAGASGYVMKTQPTQVVIETLRAAIRERTLVHGRSSGQPAVKPADKQNFRAVPDLGELTRRERNVFELLGEGMMIYEIAEQLRLSYYTVEQHRRRVKEKLGFENLGSLVQFAIRWKYGQHTEMQAIPSRN